MRFHQLSDKPISQGMKKHFNRERVIDVHFLAEFQRAARISTGHEFESHLLSLIFRIFDADDDQHL